jgi:diguanylate cyclase (GGDEF)-like protein
MVVFNIIIVIEMLVVNLYTSYICSEKKQSPFVTLACLCVFTIIFVALIFLVAAKFSYFGKLDGNGLFMIVGFIYIIPLKYLYDQSVKYTIIIMSSSWIYTMLAFSLSIRWGYLLSANRLSLSAFLFQTIFYAITIPFFLKFVRKKFIYVLSNIENSTMNSLLVLSLLWFFLVYLLNYTFVEGSSYLLESIIILVITVNAILSYKLFYSLVLVNKTANTLSERTKHDTLTKLKNREGLYEDALKKIENNTPFTIIFVDLDNFKTVNDCFGHARGDAYLIEFVNTVKGVFEISDGFYRMSGDEFILLYEGDKVESFCCEMEKLEFRNNPSGVAFGGLSMGCSYFPTDGNILSDLFHLADLKMYQQKKEKRMKT